MDILRVFFIIHFPCFTNALLCWECNENRSIDFDLEKEQQRKRRRIEIEENLDDILDNYVSPPRDVKKKIEIDVKLLFSTPINQKHV